jgi:hypothetical protein
MGLDTWLAWHSLASGGGVEVLGLGLYVIPGWPCTGWAGWPGEVWDMVASGGARFGFAIPGWPGTVWRVEVSGMGL